MEIRALKMVKGTFTKVIVAGMLAGAIALAAPQKAEAQQVGVQLGFGRGYVAPAYPAYGPVYAPVYGAPVYGRGFRDDRGFYAEHRREEFRRPEHWNGDRRFDARGGYRR